jgi:hypothetical protein
MQLSLTYTQLKLKNPAAKWGGACVSKENSYAELIF